MAFEIDNEIQQAFQDGIEEVYSTLLCNHLILRFLDESKTVVDDLYGETSNKVYESVAYELVAKVEYEHPKGVSPEETVIRTAHFRVPTKQFTTLGIPFLHEEDWERMRKAKFIYEGTEYLCEEVKPMTLVADLWQFFFFFFTEDKKSSLGRDSDAYEQVYDSEGYACIDSEGYLCYIRE